MANKVLHLIDHMGIGGAQVIISALIEMDEHDAHSLRKTETELNFVGNYTCTESLSVFNLKCLKDVNEKYNNENYDYIQCHMPKAKILGFLLKLSPSKDFKLVFHEHGSIYRGNLFYDFFVRFSDIFVDKHLTVSEKSKKLLADSGVDEDKITIIRNFADTGRFSDSKLKNYEIHRTDLEKENYSFEVGFAGRIVENKGWRTLISSSDYLEDVRIIIAGKGKEVDALNEKIFGKDEIIYLGFLDDIRQLFTRIDCLVVPSKWDPNPLIIYESLAAGVPLVVSNCASIQEVLEDGRNALFFEKEDSEDLATKINQIKENNDLRTKLVENGRHLADSNDKFNYKSEIRKFYNKISDNSH